MIRSIALTGMLILILSFGLSADPQYAIDKGSVILGASGAFTSQG